MTNATQIEDLETVVYNGIEWWSARDLMGSLGYIQWRNFSGAVERAIGIIKHGHRCGKIVKTDKLVGIGSGAKRRVVDYLLDERGVFLLSELCSGFKLNNHYSIRNETVVLQLVKKYCMNKGIDFQYQFRICPFVYDCKVGNKILIEFDEPHHTNSARQKKIDANKDCVAKTHGLTVYRVYIQMDIVDIILYLESEVL